MHLCDQSQSRLIRTASLRASPPPPQAFGASTDSFRLGGMQVAQAIQVRVLVLRPLVVHTGWNFLKGSQLHQAHRHSKAGAIHLRRKKWANLRIGAVTRHEVDARRASSSFFRATHRPLHSSICTWVVFN